MRYLLPVLAVLISLCCQAQQQLIGVKGGGLWSKVEANGLFNGSERRCGAIGGISFDRFLNEELSVGAELLYQERGFTEYTNGTDNLGNPTGEVYPINFQYDYMSLPVKATYTIGKKLFGFGSVGVVPAVLFQSTTVAPSFNSNGTYAGSEKLEATEFVRKFDCAGLVELGGGYRLMRRYWIFGVVGYQRSFTSFTTEKYFNGRTVLHWGFETALGVKVELRQ